MCVWVWRIIGWTYSTCLCCWRWASSVCTLSTSNITGRASIMKEVLAIHRAFPEDLYSHLAPLAIAPAVAEEAFLTLSGNISPRPITLSIKVSSSNSWRQDDYHFYLPPFTPKFKKYILPTFQKEMYKWGGENCYSSMHKHFNFHLSELWKAQFFMLCDAIFLVRLQGKF